MFKTTESATMEIAFGVCDHLLITKYFEFCFKAGVERLIINIDNSTIDALPFILEKTRENNDLSVFFRCHVSTYKTLHSLIPSVSTILIIKNLNDIDISGLDFRSLFLEATFAGDIDNKIIGMKSSIIWHIPFNETQWKRFNDLIELLIRQYDQDDIMIKEVLLTKSLIKAHPCNVYLCSNSHCHSKHGNFPRSLFVTAEGRMFPYGIQNDRLYIGNILSGYELIKKQYDESQEKNNFINLNKAVYLDIVDKTSYEVIPWFELIKGKLNER